MLQHLTIIHTIADNVKSADMFNNVLSSFLLKPTMLDNYTFQDSNNNFWNVSVEYKTFFGQAVELLLTGSTNKHKISVELIKE